MEQAIRLLQGLPTGVTVYTIILGLGLLLGMVLIFASMFSIGSVEMRLGLSVVVVLFLALLFSLEEDYAKAALAIIAAIAILSQISQQYQSELW